MKRVTYVFESENIGWFGYSTTAQNMNDALKEAKMEGIIGNEEVILLDSVDEDDPMYDEILDCYGVDVY